MIWIRVLGHGLIPRQKGIAPKYDPFPVDLDTIKVMLGHGSIYPEAQNPYKPTEFIRLNSQNLKAIYTEWNNVKIGSVKEENKVQVRPSSPVDRDVMKSEKEAVETAKVEKPYEPKNDKPAEKEYDKKNDKKSTLKPVGNPSDAK